MCEDVLPAKHVLCKQLPVRQWFPANYARQRKIPLLFSFTGLYAFIYDKLLCTYVSKARFVGLENSSKILVK